MRKAIFGGSFDPVHRGHLALAEKVRTGCELDEILFMPCRLSPWKETTHASGEQRLAMLRLALGDTGWDWASVSDWELRREGRSYSWMTAEHFSAEEPETAWHWIVGADQWAGIDRWARADVLPKLLRFIVVGRGGEPVEERPGWEMTSVSFDHPASSTAIREDRVRHRDWLPEAVRSYCDEHRLYLPASGDAGRERDFT